MDGGDRGKRVRSFLLGSVLGASAAVATARRRREVGRRRRARLDQPSGLAAFEGAPCYAELFEEDDEQEAVDEEVARESASG